MLTSRSTMTPNLVPYPKKSVLHSGSLDPGQSAPKNAAEGSSTDA